MKKWLLALLLLLALAGCGREKISPTASPATERPTLPTAETAPRPTEPENSDFVRALDWIPEMEQELKYAGTDNFTGTRIYPFEDAYLRYGTAKKLLAVNRALRERGLKLKLWDGYRPVSAQWKLWEVCPDPAFVADPRHGYSGHSRGNTVDVTIVDSQGRELDMPTGFDDFTAKADRDYADCTETQAENARLLEQVMEENGFTGYYGEWWHFTDTDSYPVEETFEPPLG